MVIRDLLVAIGFNVDNNSLNRVEAKIGKVRSELSSLGSVSNRAANSASNNLLKMADGADFVSNRLGNVVSALTSIWAMAGATITVGSVIGIVDEWKAINDQVSNVSASQEESLNAQKEIYRIAQATRQQYQATASLYASVATSAKELGKNQAEVLAFTEDVSRAMILGGGSTAGQQAALVQLGQALASGTLRGDELNSILEQSRRLARAIADGMGVSVGKLRSMGAEGKLTANDVFMAIRSQSDVLRTEMGKTQWRVEQAYTRMMNTAGRFFDKIEKRTGAVSMLAKGISSVADFIEGINIDNFVAGFRLLVIYAGAFYAASKIGALYSGYVMLRGILIGLKQAYLMATGAQVAFHTPMVTGAVIAGITIAKFALIAAAIAVVILAIQDFYTWVKGGKSVLGSAFGEWNELVGSVKSKWDEVTQAVSDFLDMRIIDMIKDCIGWIGKLQDKIASLNIRERVNEWWEANVSAPVNETISGVANGATAQGPELTESQQEAYSRHVEGGLVSRRREGNNFDAEKIVTNNRSADMINGLLSPKITQANVTRYATSNVVTNNAGSRTYEDNSQHTNYVNVNVKSNASPERIGNAVADSISNIGYDAGFGFDSPATEAI